MCDISERETEAKEDDADTQNAFAAKFQPTAPRFRKKFPKGVGEKHTNEDADNEGGERKMLKEGESAQCSGYSCKESDEENTWNRRERGSEFHTIEGGSKETRLECKTQAECVKSQMLQLLVYIVRSVSENAQCSKWQLRLISYLGWLLLLGAS